MYEILNKQLNWNYMVVNVFLFCPYLDGEYMILQNL